MEISSETLALIFIIAFILLLIVGVVYAISSKNMRKGYKPINSVTFFGATAEFNTADKKAAVEHILDVQADKKMEEEESGDPDKK